jgi:hypothetical protein
MVNVSSTRNVPKRNDVPSVETTPIVSKFIVRRYRGDIGDIEVRRGVTDTEREVEMEREEIDYNLFFDEGDEFAETEMEYVERSQWESLLELYESELEEIENEEDAIDLRNRIESVRDAMYGDARGAQY